MKTGIIGIGAMGAGMALNLHRAGFLHGLWNRTRDKAEKLAEQTGAACFAAPGELAAACELVLLCVSRDEDVLEMAEQVAAGVRPGAVVADASTVSSNTARRAAKILAARDAAFLDCPVSGGVEGARDGALAMMVGGDPDALARARPALDAMTASITLVGPVGSGQDCKAVNQVMCAGINQAVTEALAFGAALGLDMNKTADVVGRGAAGNWFLAHRGKTMLAGEYEAGFKVSLHHKDLAICRTLAAGLKDAALPLAEATMEQYEQLMEQGHGDEDISALYRLKRPRAG